METKTTNVTYSKVIIKDLRNSEFNDSQFAIISQTVTKLSNGKNNGYSDSLYTNIELSRGFENVETRYALIQVPKDVTKAKVQQKLDSHPECCIFKTLSNHPILTEVDEYVIEKGYKTLAQFVREQIVIYGENHEKSGKAVLDKNGNIQFRRCGFSINYKPDVDLRSNDVDFDYIQSLPGIDQFITINADSIDLSEGDAMVDNDLPF